MGAFCANAAALEADFNTERARLAANTAAAQDAAKDAQAAADAARAECEQRSAELAAAQEQARAAEAQCEEQRRAAASAAAELQAAAAGLETAKAEVCSFASLCMCVHHASPLLEHAIRPKAADGMLLVGRPGCLCCQCTCR